MPITVGPVLPPEYQIPEIPGRLKPSPISIAPYADAPTSAPQPVSLEMPQGPMNVVEIKVPQMKGPPLLPIRRIDRPRYRVGLPRREIIDPTTGRRYVAW